MTFSATRGTGGLAISPQLTLRAVVPDDSPAFRLLRSMSFFGHDAQFPNLKDRAEWVLYQLNLLFDNGEASPMDVTQDGETLLHVSKIPRASNGVLSDAGKVCNNTNSQQKTRA